MPEIAVIKSSLTMIYGRMDAPFHIAISKIYPELQRMRFAEIAKKACISQLKTLPLYALSPLRPLLRGTMYQGLNLEKAHRAIEEYPYESYLLIKQDVSKARQAFATKEADLERERLALEKFL